MKYCLVKIHRSHLSGDYVQNNFDLVVHDSLNDALNAISKLKACKLDGLSKSSQPIIDIRGRVINERGELYGFLDANESPQYFSLVEMEESRRNSFLNS